MAKALHPFIHDGRQYFIGEEVLAEGDDLKRLKETGCVDDGPSKESEAIAEAVAPDDPEEPKKTRSKKKG